MTHRYEISVQAKSTFVPDQSDLDAERYVFAYTITITNTGSVPARLVSRHWIITDENNVIQNVRGLGVIGNQPVIEPGTSYEYTSGTIFSTPLGTMRGTYEMHAADGTVFVVSKPEEKVPAGEAALVGARILERVRSLRLPHAFSPVAAVVTVSIGGATLGQDGMESAAELFEAADAQLYLAKQDGRKKLPREFHG